MGKYDRIVDIQKTPKTENNWRLVTEELEERFKHLHRITSYQAAQEFYDMVMSQIPSGADYKDLKKALRIAEISVGAGDRAGFTVHAPMKASRVRKLDVPKTVIYVRAKKRLIKPDPAVQILEDYGPWTADTIPFWPKKKKADVVQRKVTKKEADKVAKAQKTKESEVWTKLGKIGVRIKKPKPGQPGAVSRDQKKAIPDVGMLALTLEFGGEGKRSNPVFRKSLRKVTAGMGGMSKRYRIFKDTVSNPNTKRYKRYPKKMDKISTGKARAYVGFQKRIK